MFNNRILLTGLMMLTVSLIYAQQLRMTFVAIGASATVDSVKATNLRTNQSVAMPGSDTLLLNYTLGIPGLQGTGRNGLVFPNPCEGKAILEVPSPQAQTALVKLMSLSGQVLCTASAELVAGFNLFRVSLARPGVYLVSLQTGRSINGFKIICTKTAESANTIAFSGALQGNAGASLLKSTNVYSLDFTAGDILLYRCRGGVHTTIITDIPDASKSYTVEFVPCIDPSGKSYAIVKIGAQTWMAENLAWLPQVMPSDTGAENLRFYYVYGFQDTTVNAAKSDPNYLTYGVLYNWPAAMSTTPGKFKAGVTTQSICPSGWHLPSDNEWKLLEIGLGMSTADADTLYSRSSGDVGMKLKATNTWPEDSLTSNLSGFTALPAGYRNTHGTFDGLHNYSLFWTSSPSDTMAWYRLINFNDRGVYRMTTIRSHGMSVRCIKND